MNVTVGDTTLSINVSIVSSDEYTDAKGVNAILQAWCDRPSRTWLLSDPHYVIVSTEGDDGRPRMDQIFATDADLYSLNAISVALGESTRQRAYLRWAEGIGEPSVEAQMSLLQSLRSRLDMGGIPTDEAALTDLFLQVVGEAL